MATRTNPGSVETRWPESTYIWDLPAKQGRRFSPHPFATKRAELKTLRETAADLVARAVASGLVKRAAPAVRVAKRSPKPVKKRTAPTARQLATRARKTARYQRIYQAKRRLNPVHRAAHLAYMKTWRAPRE